MLGCTVLQTGKVLVGILFREDVYYIFCMSGSFQVDEASCLLFTKITYLDSLNISADARVQHTSQLHV